MKVYLELTDALYQELMGHLLPGDALTEQAAFLFASSQQRQETTLFQVVDYFKARSEDFVSQEGDYLQLSDATRAKLIKRAHDLGTSLVELHSHPGPFPVAFSLADRFGLIETVPHMWWRLNGRPYLAIVVGPTGFDALLWLDNPKIPRRLDGVRVEGRLTEPTNSSLGGWR